MYSEDAIADLHSAYQSVMDGYSDLLTDFTSFAYKTAEGREHGLHGYGRRLKILKRCVSNVYSLVPPEDEDQRPDAGKLSDVLINLQAFVFNVFGALDNLAWLLVAEMNLTKENGKPLHKKQVNLSPSNHEFLSILPTSISTKMMEYKEWYAQMGEFRHALAHRIPFYVPPYLVIGDDIERYNALEKQKWARIKAKDIEGYVAADEEQDRLGKFRPIIAQSPSSGSRTIAFHPQLIADISTVEELGRLALSGLAPSAQTRPRS